MLISSGVSCPLFCSILGTLVELYCLLRQDASKGVDDEGDLLNRNSTVELVARVIATQWFQSIYTSYEPARSPLDLDSGLGDS